MKYEKLSQIKELYKSVFYMEEDMVLDTILSIAIATKLPGDPIWLLIIGGSSSGKSELIGILNKVKFNHPVSSLSENTFLSNMKLGAGKESSLLHQIGTNGMITMKDYTSILSMRSEKRELIVSQMREIFDGKLDKLAGNGNNEHWEGKINWIGAVTDSIFIAEGESAGMGRRTINYVMPQQDRIKTTRRALANTADITEKRLQIQDAVAEFINHKLATLPKQLPVLSEDMQEDVIQLGNFTTLARTPTARDFHQTLILVPDAEMPMRVASMFQKIVQINIHISDDGVLTDAHWKQLCKLAFDSIPKQRIMTLKILAKYPMVTKKGVALELNYPTDTVGMWLEDLNVLGICKRAQGSATSGDQWTMEPQYRELMVKFMDIKLKEEALIDDASETGETFNPTPPWMSAGGTDDKGELKEQAKNADLDFENF